MERVWSIDTSMFFVEFISYFLKIYLRLSVINIKPHSLQKTHYRHHKALGKNVRFHYVAVCQALCSFPFVCLSTWAVGQWTAPVSIQLTGEWWVSHELSVSRAGKAHSGARGKFLPAHDRMGRCARVAAVNLYITQRQQRKIKDAFLGHSYRC